MFISTAFAQGSLFGGAGGDSGNMVMSLLPFQFANDLYLTTTVGASGAIYGLLAAFGIMFANRPIYMYFLFPVPARVFALITGAFALFWAVTSSQGGIAHLAHLGGLVTGWALMMRGRGGLAAEIKYRYTKWRLQRARRKFDVHQGGRGGGWNVH